MKEQFPERFTLTLADEPQAHDDAPPAVRLRQVLKRLLRSYGFRCVDVRGEESGNATLDNAPSNR